MPHPYPPEFRARRHRPGTQRLIDHLKDTALHHYQGLDPFKSTATLNTPTEPWPLKWDNRFRRRSSGDLSSMAT